MILQILFMFSIVFDIAYVMDIGFALQDKNTGFETLENQSQSQGINNWASLHEILRKSHP